MSSETPSSPVATSAPTPVATPVAGDAGPKPGPNPGSSAGAAAAMPSIGRRYAWVLLTGVLGYLVISAVLLSAYVITEGRGFFIPMRWPTLAFVQLFAAPTFLAGFLPFAGAHMIATTLKMRITPRSAAISGAAMGAMAAWAICGRQGCFGPFGSYPLLGWYIAACCLLSALFYQLNARKQGF